jgi:hypothetical protein
MVRPAEAQVETMYDLVNLYLSPAPSQELAIAVCRAVVASNATALTLLKRASSLDPYYRPIEASQAPYPESDHLSFSRLGCWLLSAEGVLNGYRGQHELVEENVLMILGMARHLRTEPTLAAQLAAIAHDETAMRLIQVSVSLTRIPPPRLRDLMEAFATLPEPPIFKRALAGCIADLCLIYEERLASVYWLRRFEWFRNGALERAAENVDSALYALSGQSRADYLLAMESSRKAASIAGLPFPERLDAAKALEDELFRLSGDRVLPLQGIPVTGTHLACARHRALVNVTRVGLGVELHFAENGRLPRSLADLSPDILEIVPVDPFTGEQLSYHTNEHGYVVYSFGRNRRDDRRVEEPGYGFFGNGLSFDQVGASDFYQEDDIVFRVERRTR